MKILLLIVVSVLAVLGLLVLFGLIWLRTKVRGLVSERMGKVAEEEKTIEQANWFGKTGLDEATERELPRYLRREFGETLFDEGALKAADLTYVGAFHEADGLAHYWKVPYGDDGDVYASVVVQHDGVTCTGWGGREPPQGAALAASAAS